MTEYIITRRVLSESRTLSISQDDYDKTLRAWNGVLEVLGLEERVNIVLENYCEFEQELLELALHRALFRGGDWSSFVGDIHVANRRLANLLASGRLYLDQARHAMSTLYGSTSNEFERVKVRETEVYDNRLGYRVMEKLLRNYSLHRGLPLHGLTTPYWVDETGEDRRVRCSVVPYIRPGKLREDPWFKETSERNSVLSELETVGDQIDLRPLIRSYVSGLTEIHGTVREIVDDGYSDWRTTVKAVPEKWRKEVAEEDLGVGVGKLSKEGELEDFQTIFLDPIERTDDLRLRIREHPSLENLIITSEEKTG